MDLITEFHRQERDFITLVAEAARAYWARFIPLQKAACSIAGGWNHRESWLAIGRELLASGFAHDDPVDWLPNSSDLDRVLRVLLAAALRGNRETIAQQIEAVAASNTVRRSVVESLVWSLPESILREWARRNREAEQAKVELAVQQSGLHVSRWQQAIALAAAEGWFRESGIQQAALEAYLGSHIAPSEDLVRAIEPSSFQRAEGEKATADNPPMRSKKVSRDEANLIVREWLEKNAKDDPDSVTRDQIVEATGISAGSVSNTSAWKAFVERRNAVKKPSSREIPLSDQIRANIPVDAVGKAESEQRFALVNELIQQEELNKLIQEQKEDQDEETRRHKRRHGPS